MCIIEQVEREWMSYVTGRIVNNYGNEWQIIADKLSELAQCYGSIIRVNLSKSIQFENYIDFTILFDDISSAKKMFTACQATYSLTNTNQFYDMVYFPLA